MISDKKKEYMRRYYQKHKDELREKRKQKRHENPEEYRERARKYYKEHKDVVYGYQKKWISKNRKKFSDLCHESRKRRVERLKVEGIINPWAVVVFGKEPVYEVVK